VGYSIKTDLKAVGGESMNCTNLDQNVDQWQVLVDDGERSGPIDILIK
jgi:hypothetical protein